jgi:dihydroorotase
MAQLTITGGRVLLDGDLTVADIVIQDGRIAAITDSAPASDQQISAAGRLVLPGVIDSHVHFREPGYAYKEDFGTGSRAAAAGGITMVMDMPNLDPAPSTVEAYRAQRAIAEAKSVVDFNHWASPVVRSEIPGLAAAGALGFKFFMKSAHYPYDGPWSVTDHADILETLRAIAGTGLPCAVHPHDMMLWQRRVEEATAAGRVGLMDWNEVTYGDDNVVETTAIATLALLATAVGADLRILHIQGAPQIRVTRMLKAAGYGFIAETNPWAVFRIDPLAVRGEESEALNWEALRDGTIDIIGTDHAPHTYDEHMEVRRSSLQSVVAAYPLCEHALSLYLTEVHAGRISLARLSDLLSRNVARHLGLYPRKGAIRVGSDADLVVVDMDREAVLGDSYPVYSKQGFTPLEGRTVRGVPTHTIVRGEVVMEDGKILASPGCGRFVERDVSETAAGRPALTGGQLS